eukprot:scaffold74044_cov32-Tisochrysis_lutea.AAC.6
MHVQRRAWCAHVQPSGRLDASRRCSGAMACNRHAAHLPLALQLLVELDNLSDESALSVLPAGAS